MLIFAFVIVLYEYKNLMKLYHRIKWRNLRVYGWLKEIFKIKSSHWPTISRPWSGVSG